MTKLSSLQRNTSALRSAVNCLFLRPLPPPVARDHQTLSVMGKPHGPAPGVESYAPEWVWAANPRGRQHVHSTADAGLAVCRPAPVCCSCAQHRAQPRTGEVPVQGGGPPRVASRRWVPETQPFLVVDGSQSKSYCSFVFQCI